MLGRAADVASTWRDNRYPGCACDVPSGAVFVSNLIRPGVAVSPDSRRSWDYLQRGAQRYGLAPRIRSGRSDLDDDLRNRWVAVVGTGASAIQFRPVDPAHSRRARAVQRTPASIMPRSERCIGAVEQRLYRVILSVQQLVRAGICCGRWPGSRSCSCWSPNTGLGHTSLIYMIESQVAYTIEALRYLRRTGRRGGGPVQSAGGVQPRCPTADAGHRMDTGGCASWYLDAHGYNTTAPCHPRVLQPAENLVHAPATIRPCGCSSR